MRPSNNNKFGLMAAGLLTFGALTGLLAPVTANAALVSGAATITIDNDAFTASNAYGLYVEKFWDSSDNSLNITRNTTGGADLAQHGSTAMVFPVNNNTIMEVLAPSCNTCTPKEFGRTLQPTTMDTTDTSVGKIGLSGAWRLNSIFGKLTPYDFNLSKNASGQWIIKTYDSVYLYQEFLKLVNVSEAFDENGQLLLSGDLQWSGPVWPMMAGVDTTAAPVTIGSLSLAPAAVPIPAAAWMFGSALLGLLGVNRKLSERAA